MPAEVRLNKRQVQELPDLGNILSERVVAPVTPDHAAAQLVPDFAGQNGCRLRFAETFHQLQVGPHVPARERIPDVLAEHEAGNQTQHGQQRSEADALGKHSGAYRLKRLRQRGVGLLRVPACYPVQRVPCDRAQYLVSLVHGHRDDQTRVGIPRIDRKRMRDIVLLQVVAHVAPVPIAPLQKLPQATFLPLLGVGLQPCVKRQSGSAVEHPAHSRWAHHIDRLLIRPFCGMVRQSAYCPPETLLARVEERGGDRLQIPRSGAAFAEVRRAAPFGHDQGLFVQAQIRALVHQESQRGQLGRVLTGLSHRLHGCKNPFYAAFEPAREVGRGRFNLPNVYLPHAFAVQHAVPVADVFGPFERLDMAHKEALFQSHPGKGGNVALAVSLARPSGGRQLVRLAFGLRPRSFDHQTRGLLRGRQVPFDMVVVQQPFRQASYERLRGVAGHGRHKLPDTRNENDGGTP